MKKKAEHVLRFFDTEIFASSHTKAYRSSGNNKNKSCQQGV